MSTVAQNNLLTGGVHGEGFLYHAHVPVSNSTFPINQGDLVYWDGTAHIAKVVGSDANAAALLGVALGSSAFNSNLDNSSATVAVYNIEIGYNVIASFKTTNAETYAEGTAVYIGADAQTITTVAGTNKVGVVRLPPRGSAVTGASGVTVPVLVYSHAFVSFGA